MNTKINKTDGERKVKKRSSRRTLFLFGLLAIVVGVSLYDLYVVMPSADSRFQKFVSEVSENLSESNLEDTHEIIGFPPFESFEYKGLQVERYNFSRALPFYPKSKLDVAFRDGELFCFRQERITEKFLENRLPKAEIGTKPRAKLDIIRGG